MNKTNTKADSKCNILINADNDLRRKINIGSALLGMSKKDLAAKAINQFLSNNAALKKMNFQQIVDEGAK